MEIQLIKPKIRELLDEKDDLFAYFGVARKWEKNKIKSGRTVIALENCC